jgi:hypothetical protein
MENLMQYYGVDWIGMFATFFSLYWLADKKWYGFAIGSISSLCWAIFGILTHSLPATFANFVFFFMNIRGILKWRKNKN